MDRNNEQFGPNNAYLSEIRCRRCNRLLFRGRVDYVEIKCPKCHCVQCVNAQGVLMAVTKPRPAKL